MVLGAAWSAHCESEVDDVEVPFVGRTIPSPSTNELVGVVEVAGSKIFSTREHGTAVVQCVAKTLWSAAGDR